MWDRGTRSLCWNQSYARVGSGLQARPAASAHQTIKDVATVAAPRSCSADALLYEGIVSYEPMDVQAQLAS